MEVGMTSRFTVPEPKAILVEGSIYIHLDDLIAAMAMAPAGYITTKSLADFRQRLKKKEPKE